MEQQVLSQSEVDALLNAVSDGRIDSQESDDKREDASFVRYDLTNQDRIIRGRMPTLDIIHDRFIRLFRVSLSAALRKVANIGVNRQKFKEGSRMKKAAEVACCLSKKLPAVIG